MALCVFQITEFCPTGAILNFISKLETHNYVVGYVNAPQQGLDRLLEEWIVYCP